MTPEPFPNPIRGTELNSWANHTIVVRLPEIARRTLAENNFPPQTVAKIEELASEIPETPIRHLRSENAPDAALWHEYVQPYLGQDWLEPPWFFIETYFYRRVLEATGYFEPGAGRAADPFAYQKQQGLMASQAAIHLLSHKLTEWIAQGGSDEALEQLLLADLWGNRADMSLWPADEAAPADHAAATHSQDYLLVDDSRRVIKLLHNRQHNPKGSRVDFMIDNAGFELIGDLALADYLLSIGAIEEVWFHLKQHPTFVSDAMIVDVQETAVSLTQHPATQAWGERLLGGLANGRFQLHSHPFWTSPLPFWQLPADLRAVLSQSSLIISKGDANYRRLLGDRHWPFSTPFDKILHNAPAPLVALRTLKAEIAAGLKTEQIERLNNEEIDWLVNGRYGVIQYSSCSV